MLELTSKQKKQIKEDFESGDKETFVINGKKYYCKNTFFPGIEIVAKKLADKVGITCANYEIINFGNSKEDDYFYFSEDLAKEGYSIATLEYLQLNTMNLYDIWGFLEKNFPDNVEEAMQKIIKIFFFDCLIQHGDRHTGNWLIIYKGDHIYDVCILDNELIMHGHAFHMSSHISDEFGDLDEYNYVDSFKELGYFLDTSDKSYLDEFKLMLDTLTPDVFSKIIDEVENENQLVIDSKDRMIKKYINNYSSLLKLVNKRGLK